jgi:hypothetical protein
MLKHWKKIACAGLFLASLQVPAFAQNGDNIYIYNKATKPAPWQDENEGPAVTRTLTIRPTGFIKSNFFVGFEQQIAEKKSLQLFGGVTAADYSNYYSARDVLGFNGEAQFRFYLQNNKKGLSGLYAGPYAFYKTIKMEAEDWDPACTTPDPNNPWVIEPCYISYKGSSGGGGVLIGYQLLIKNVGVIDVFTGGGIRISDSTPVSTDNFNTRHSTREFSSSGIYPNIGIQIGMGF